MRAGRSKRTRRHYAYSTAPMHHPYAPPCLCASVLALVLRASAMRLRLKSPEPAHAADGTEQGRGADEPSIRLSMVAVLLVQVWIADRLR